jgi:putative addiction module component (TIGR02574 family)
MIARSREISSTLQQLGIDKMSLEERYDLVDEIIVSIGADFVMPECHKELLDERIAETEANPGVGSSWEEVKNRLLKKKP